MSSGRKLTDWLPVTKKEVELRGWDELDIILLSGDAYVDHPSFGIAVIGRILEAEGLRVAIVPQPNWKDDLRDFKKLGRPRLFFGISAGCMDSMVNRYTANRRYRSEDAYTPDGRHDLRPEYPTIVYTQILKKLYPDTPVVIGGIEASMRRFTHYDYWQDKLLPSILCDSGADLLVYGMGEQPMTEVARRSKKFVEESGCPQMMTHDFGRLTEDIAQTGHLAPKEALSPAPDDLLLASHEECTKDKKRQAANFGLIEEESNKWESRRILQPCGKVWVVMNAPYPPMTTQELDHSFDLPYTRLPHPKYNGKRIPAFEMIQYSVNIHRGCFGGCAFCTISAHQGKQVVSRSRESILKEVQAVSEMPGFKGYLSDLGGPSANMYGMRGKEEALCRRCKRPSCIHPGVCPNLQCNHTALLDLYHAVDALPCIKKSFIGSGVRYDLLLHRGKDEESNRAAEKYTRELITRHVSGRLKVAPEHTSQRVLDIMRKPSFSQFEEFNRIFHLIDREAGLHQQLIPYFISSHPGCTPEDMALLAVITKRLDFHLEQVQDFTPTPMTMATEMYYTGYNPYTLERVYCARTPQEKLEQRQFFFWYQPQERAAISAALRRMGRSDLIKKIFD